MEINIKFMLQAFHNASFRVKFCLGISTILLPLVIFAGGTFYALENLAASYHETTEEVIEEIPPVSQLKTLVFLAQMPPNDYLINHNPEEKKTFSYFVQQIDQNMTSLKETSFDHPAEQTLATLVIQSWENGKQLAAELFAIHSPAKNTGANQLMKDFDEQLNRCTWALDQLELFAFKEIREAQEHTEKNIASIRLSLAGTLIVGLLLSILSGLLLAKSVLAPLKMLSQGAAQISRGEFEPINYPAHNEFGAVIAAFNSMSVSLQKVQTDLKELAMRDGLTGLLNRREFEHLLAQELDRAKRGQNSVSLILLDIDHFKQVNDNHGHQVGDEVLRNLAKLLAKQIRTMDHLARYGGEEFVVIAPTDITTALNIAERIRHAVEISPQQDYQQKSFKVTVSLGISSFPASADKREELIRKADEALYRAKQSGRNQTCLYETPEKNT